MHVQHIHSPNTVRFLAPNVASPPPFVLHPIVKHASPAKHGHEGGDEPQSKRALFDDASPVQDVQLREAIRCSLDPPARPTSLFDPATISDDEDDDDERRFDRELQQALAASRQEQSAADEVVVDDDDSVEAEPASASDPAPTSDVPRGTDAHVYRLASLVHHYGEHMSSGHYVADVLEPRSGTWRHCNDARVSTTTRADVCMGQRRRAAGYILFYASDAALLRAEQPPAP